MKLAQVADRILMIEDGQVVILDEDNKGLHIANDKKNKTRSILIMMSICLTTMLLVIISTVGNGMIRLQKSQAAGSYGSNYDLFVAADASQLADARRRAEIDAIGIMCQRRHN